MFTYFLTAAAVSLLLPGEGSDAKLSDGQLSVVYSPNYLARRLYRLGQSWWSRLKPPPPASTEKAE